jgi:hypothetical protein
MAVGHGARRHQAAPDGHIGFTPPAMEITITLPRGASSIRSSACCGGRNSSVAASSTVAAGPQMRFSLMRGLMLAVHVAALAADLVHGVGHGGDGHLVETFDQFVHVFCFRFFVIHQG